jgi:hypothetical protein
LIVGVVVFGHKDLGMPNYGFSSWVIGVEKVKLLCDWFGGGVCGGR